MAVSAQRINVGDVRARLAQVAVIGPSETATRGSHGGAVVLVRNRGAASVDIGGADVASGAGFELSAGVEREFHLDPGEALYAVSAAAAVNRCDVLRSGEAVA